MELRDWLDRAVTAVRSWEAGYGEFDRHRSLRVDPDRFDAAFGELTGRLRDNYPYFHPSYAGQMLKPPHPAAVAGYLAAMLINPNNHALDGGPATSAMEKEVVARLAAMFGLPDHLGHLTSSGTIANLEALWVARELHPGRGIAYGAEAHYTHGRMCGVLGVPGTAVPADGRGRMDLDALDDLLAGGRIGTVVATAGSTGLGAIDPVHEVLAVARRHGARVHVDAAYGGFFTLLAGRGDAAGLDPAPWQAIAGCDSVVVDPHKHGLQPYGCGAILFRDPSVGRLYRHDSPYTYFTSDDLHLGEISLECSRSGAAAAALWLTFELLPPVAGHPSGLGEVLAAGRRAALDWSTRLANSSTLDLYQPPDLDIVCYFPLPAAPPTLHPDASPGAPPDLPSGASPGLAPDLPPGASPGLAPDLPPGASPGLAPGPAPGLAAIDRESARMLTDGMHDKEHPVFLSTLTVSADAFARRHPGVHPDATQARILRSVLMKPESETYVAELHARIEVLASS